MDFISQFMQLTEGAMSPTVFRKWAGIGLVAGALERRVWTRTRRGRTMPSLFTMLVAPPGVGKQVLDEARDLVRGLAQPHSGPAYALHLSSDSMTKASMMDELMRAKQIFLPPEGPSQEFHSLFAIAEEVGVLVPAYDVEFINMLTKLYNNPGEISETRRHGPTKELIIKAPQMNLLAGVQPGWLIGTLPETAWEQGFMSRMIMVYSAEDVIYDIFGEDMDMSAAHTATLGALRRLTRVWGECSWAEAAAQRLEQWHRAGGPPKPTHSKLTHYNRRRGQHALKLSMIAAVSRTGTTRVDLQDVDRALEWLFEAEATMPDIFRAMVGRSDTQVLDELYLFVLRVWQMQSSRPVHQAKIYDFLRQRVPGEKIAKLVEVAERSQMLDRLAGTETFIPRARDEHGAFE